MIFDNLPIFDEWIALTNQLLEWLIKNVLTLSSLQQILVVIALMIGAGVLSRKLASTFEEKTASWRAHHFSMISMRIHLSVNESLSLVLTPMLLWVAVMVANAAKWQMVTLNIAASLVTAWAMIRLGSSLVKSNFWSKTLALSMWTIAALNIVGWLDPTIEVLGNAVIPLGDHKLSLLAILKGGVLLTLFLWLAGLSSEGLERALWRSNLSPSQKVLFHKIAKIILIGIAIMLGLNVVGIDFTALAVFSGALGIGIGFGLQKVFANLMSGFILLIDKSIKPGDVIAVGDTYGWVNRLGARCVSILTRDGKEHLIPNETLITQPVENWTYSDDMVRIHIPIGVSYNSDVPLVKKLLLEVARNHPRIIQNPEPSCLIKGFGDNSVDFEIRAWIEDPVNGIGNVRSGVYEEVWKVFKANNIVVPFPQRDLNLNMEQIKEIIKMVKNNV